jgi:hypothetical protein
MEYYHLKSMEKHNYFIEPKRQTSSASCNVMRSQSSFPIHASCCWNESSVEPNLVVSETSRDFASKFVSKVITDEYQTCVVSESPTLQRDIRCGEFQLES